MNLREIAQAVKETLTLYGPSNAFTHAVGRIRGREVPWQRDLHRRSGGDHLDRKLGVRTAMIIKKEHSGVPEELVETSEHHVPVNPKVLNMALKAARIHYPDFTFVDVGSGLGRAILIASNLGFRRLVGIELSSQLHELAIENLKIVSGSGRSFEYELLNINALEFDFPKEPLCLLLHRPFTSQVMAAFLRRLETSYRSDPRKIVVVSIMLYKSQIYENVPCLRMTEERIFRDHRQSWRIYETEI